MKRALIKRSGRHQFDVVDEQSGEVLSRGYGALGRGWDNCEGWLLTHGYTETKDVGVWQMPSPSPVQLSS